MILTLDLWQRLLEEHGATSMLALINHLPRARAQEVHAQRATRFARMCFPDSAPAHIEAQCGGNVFALKCLALTSPQRRRRHRQNGRDAGESSGMDGQYVGNLR